MIQMIIGIAAYHIITLEFGNIPMKLLVNPKSKKKSDVNIEGRCNHFSFIVICLTQHINATREIAIIIMLIVITVMMRADMESHFV